MSLITHLAESGRLPDSVLEYGIRRLLRQRLGEWDALSFEKRREHVRRFTREISRGPVARHTDAANAQHYEVPAEFFAKVLGPRRKYSSCVFPGGVTQLGEAEDLMLALTCKRAGLRDGQRILELGCGWGSLTLWMAEKYPNAQITAVSNSASQRRHIQRQLQERGLTHVDVVTRDMNDFAPPAGAGFDRVVSVEMFEHMHNIAELFRRVSTWLAPDGRVFLHVFIHREYPYFFETEGEDNWMGRHFFTGGMMPSEHLYYGINKHLVVADHWRVSGTHYGRTARCWLQNLDRHRDAVLPILGATYGERHATKWLHRWRIFFLACAELWEFDHGREWAVGHYVLRKR